MWLLPIILLLIPLWPTMAAGDTWKLTLKNGTTSTIEADTLKEHPEYYEFIKFKGQFAARYDKNTVQDVQLIQRSTPPPQTTPTPPKTPQPDGPTVVLTEEDFKRAEQRILLEEKEYAPTKKIKELERQKQEQEKKPQHILEQEKRNLILDESLEPRNA